MHRFPPGMRRIRLVIAAGFSNYIDIGLDDTSLSSFMVVRWVRVERSLMLNVNGFCRRGLASVLGLVACAVLTPVAWGDIDSGELPCVSITRKVSLYWMLWVRRNSGTVW